MLCIMFVFQFFNPGAFAPVNTLPQAPPTGTNPQEPQDDAVCVNYCSSLLVEGFNSTFLPWVRCLV